jgi:alkylation response protein AidB-like acyl-CoA dehydrogenase
MSDHIAAAQAETALSPVERARQLSTTIAEAASEIDRQRRLPRTLLDRLHEARLFRLLMPASVGGEEVAPLAFLEMLETVARADASTAWCLSQTSVCSMSAALLRADVAQHIFGEKEALLAWGFGPNGRATACEGGYRISGNWGFCSGGHHATWLGGLCAIHEADGTPLRDAAGRPVTRMMLFPQKTATMRDVWDVLGLRGTGSDAYGVTDLVVPEAHSLQFGSLPQSHARGVLYLFPLDSFWASGFASVALGLAQSMLEALAALAREKTPRGFKRPLSESPAIQALVARGDGELRAARLFLCSAVEEAWAEVKASRKLELERRMTIRLAASHAIKVSQTVGDECYHAAGATAVFAANPFERRFRDMHAVTQHVHGRQSHFEVVGQFMLGLTPEIAFL